jgi:hypothetical protein
MACAVRPRGGGGGSGSVIVPPRLVGCRWRWRRRTTPRSGGFARQSTSLAFRPRCWTRSTAVGCAAPRRQARHARRRHPDRRRSQAPLRGRRRQPARSGCAGDDERKKAYFGYEAHLAVDEVRALVREAERPRPMCMTPVWPKRWSRATSKAISPTRPTATRRSGRRSNVAD